MAEKKETRFLFMGCVSPRQTVGFLLLLFRRLLDNALHANDFSKKKKMSVRGNCATLS